MYLKYMYLKCLHTQTFINIPQSPLNTNIDIMCILISILHFILIFCESLNIQHIKIHKTLM